MKKNSFIIMVTAMAFAMAMTSCQKEDEKTGTATGGTEVVDTLPPLNPIDTIVPPDTIAPPVDSGIVLTGTTWYCRVEVEAPESTTIV